MGKRYTEAEKVRAWELYCEGCTYQEIADAIGCSVDLIKRSWSKKWKERKAAVVEKVRMEAEYVQKTTVAIEKMELDHLMALRELYHTLLEQVKDCEPDPERPWKYLSVYKEIREIIMASAKLEGVEPPQKVLNLTVHTDANRLREHIRKYEELFDE